MAPDDIRPEMFVTILERAPKRVSPTRSPFSLPGESWQDSETLVPNRRGLGIPFLVVSVSLPFVILQTAEGERVIEDTRTLTLKQVPEEYAAAWVKQAERDVDTSTCPPSILDFYHSNFFGLGAKDGDE